MTRFSDATRAQKLAVVIGAAVLLCILPFVVQMAGNAWVRIIVIALLYVLLALGLNIVVGYAGLLDLGYVAFYAVGAYMLGLLASPQLTDTFPAIAAAFPNGLHTPWWLVIPIGALVAGGAGVLLGAPTLKLRGDYLAIVTLGFGEIIRIFLNNLSRPVNITSGPQGIALIAGGAGVLLGTPTLKLRGDYLAIVTLGFGEIIRVFMNNLEAPVNITNGPRGLDSIDPVRLFGFDFGKDHSLFGLEFHRVVMPSYYLFLLLVVASVLVCYRLERSRIGRAWMAIREDEIAAKAMGINTRNMKLLAFGMGATFGGVSGAMFASFQGFVSPESFSLQESIMIVAMVVLGGIGHIPGVILGALMLSALPEVLRYVAGDIQSMTDGRIDASILRQLLVALAMIIIMLVRPRGLWPAPEHGKSAAPAAK